MKTRLLSLTLLFVSLSSVHAAPKTPAETLKEMFDQGTQVSFLEIDGAWLFGECYGNNSTDPIFQIASTGFQKTFGDNRGPLFPAFQKGYFFATAYDPSAPFGKVTEERFEMLKSHVSESMQDVKEAHASWDSRTPETVGLISRSDLLVSVESEQFPLISARYVYLKKSGDYYVSYLYTADDLYCYQVKASIE